MIYLHMVVVNRACGAEYAGFSYQFDLLDFSLHRDLMVFLRCVKFSPSRGLVLPLRRRDSENRALCQIFSISRPSTSLTAARWRKFDTEPDFRYLVAVREVLGREMEKI